MSNLKVLKKRSALALVLSALAALALVFSGCSKADRGKIEQDLKKPQKQQGLDLGKVEEGLKKPQKEQGLKPETINEGLRKPQKAQGLKLQKAECDPEKEDCDKKE